MSIEAQKIIVFLAFGMLAALIMCGVALALVAQALERGFKRLTDHLCNSVTRIVDVERANAYPLLSEKLREGPTHGGMR